MTNLCERKTVASIVPWSQVCRMLDKVQSTSREKKRETLLLFIDKFRACLAENTSNSEDSFFPALRVLLPALDRERGAYGVKERKLADLYIKTLAIRKGSADAGKLLNFSKPKVSGKSAGDFADVAFYVLKNYCPEKGSLSLQDVDSCLTTIAQCHASKDPATVDKCLLRMLRGMTASEQKWLIRVLLKELRLGMGQTAIFSAWHPDAKEYYDVNNSLRKVCLTLKEPSVRLHEIEISLFSPFRPMLAERAVLDKVETQMKHKTYHVEVKYDGERSQIHKKGKQYKYFSRNGFDFSQNFGVDPSSGLFTPSLHPLFADHVNEVILDGEIIGWSRSLKTFVTKGENMDVKNLREGGDWQVCFCAFDILYLNGKVLTNLPLTSRREMLKKALIATEGRMVIALYSEATTKNDVVNALNEATDRREEGIILKDPDSPYQAAARRAGWIKVKPDYVDSGVPDLDLLIVGGYYGKGRRGGVISHFLLALIDDTATEGGTTKKFHTVSRVGSGYTASELQDLSSKLSKNIVRKCPENVLVARETPDIWFVPEKSSVVQVKGSEIVKSSLYPTGFTLRFPRVEKTRPDKLWHDVLTLTEFKNLSEASKGKIANSLSIEENKTFKSKVQKVNHRPTLSEAFKPADTSRLIQKGHIFKEMEFCVLGGGGGKTKHELEALVVENGGSFTQHPGKNTSCIVCEAVCVRARNFISQGMYNVVKISWVLDCVESGLLLPWRPTQIFFLRPEERQKMEAEFDDHGDSFFIPVDGSSLKSIMDAMKVENKSEIRGSSVIDDLPSTKGRGQIFRNFRVFFAQDELKGEASDHILNLKIRMHGGSMESDLGEDTTHIVVDTDRNINKWKEDFPSKIVVTKDWIYDSINEAVML